MSCRSNTKATVLTLAGLAMSCVLSGCSDIYFDRRETVVPYAGDAKAVNQVTMMVDPWPPYSANRNIAFNGEVMQRAVERYREGRVIPPCNLATSSVASGKCAAAAAEDESAKDDSKQNNSNATVQQQTPSPWAGSQTSQTTAQSQP